MAKGIFQIQAIRNNYKQARYELIAFAIQYFNSVPFISLETKTQFKELFQKTYTTGEILSESEREFYETEINDLKKRLTEVETLLQSLDVNNI